MTASLDKTSPTRHNSGDPVTHLNYVDVRHEYFGPADDEGVRLRSVDVWHATRPSTPEYGLVDNEDNPIEEQQAEINVAWTIGRAGGKDFVLFDKDDINGLRALLNRLEEAMTQDEEDKDRKAIAELVDEFEQANREDSDDSL